MASDLKDALRAALSPALRRLVPERWQEVPDRTGDLQSAICANERMLFELPLYMAVDRAGRRFSNAESHPLTRAAAQIIAGDSSPARADLHRWYQRNSPASWGDLFHLGVDVPLAIRPRDRFLLPWEGPGRVTQKTPLYGPAEAAQCEGHVARLESLVQSIGNGGYGRPADPIRGYVLWSHGPATFVVKGGQHRVAVLAALGHRTALVTWQPDWPRLVQAEQAEFWPQVRNGAIDRAMATTVFAQFTKLSGSGP